MTVRIVLQGFGAMGQACANALRHRADGLIVGVLDTAPHLIGRTVADVLDDDDRTGLRVAHPDTVNLAALRADVALHTTTAFAEIATPQIERLLAARMDIVTICQELVHPVKAHAGSGARIDACARRHDRSVVAAGVNPGWILDVLPVAASLGCVDIRSLTVSRVVDFSPYGPDEMTHIGAGADESAFREGAESGTIGHIGLLESATLVNDALELGVDRWEQTKVPLLARRRHQTEFTTVEAGKVRGFRQRVLGWREGEAILDFTMVGLLDVDGEDPSLGDRIHIEATPSMDLTVHGEDTSDGGRATAGVATNLIGSVIDAAPGLHTVLSLPLTRSRTTLRFPQRDNVARSNARCS